MQVNIICHTVTNRLEYTLDFIFNDVLRTGYILHREMTTGLAGPIIIYGGEPVAGTYAIRSEGLLFEDHLRETLPPIIGEKEHARIFSSAEGDDFDLFSAVFYLISRYEEYLPYQKDLYERFPHTQSLAYRYGFLQLPLADLWILNLAKELSALYPDFSFPKRTSTWVPTYDIDMAWSYRKKGFLRNLGGFIKSPGLDRILTLLHLKQDPFDSFSFLEDLEKKYQLHPIYFWLVAIKKATLDRNISPLKKEMRDLIQKKSKNKNGIHPSWYSGDDNHFLQVEINTLEEILGKKVKDSRQHYLRFTLPETYRNLIQCGITSEYSMGYGTINGFRASTSHPFFWFNLGQNKKTELRVHPFCFMDANSFYEQQLNADEALQELLGYWDLCQETGGTLVTIFHNNFLGTDPRYKGWKDMYEKFIRAIHSGSSPIAFCAHSLQ